MTRDQAKHLSPSELLELASKGIKEKDAQDEAVKAGEARVAERHRQRDESARVLQRQRSKGQGLEALHARWLTMDADDMTRIAVFAQIPDELLADRAESWKYLLEHTEALTRALPLLAVG